MLLALPSLFGAGLLWAVKLLIDEVFVAQKFEYLALFLALYLFIGAGKALSSYLRAGSTPRLWSALRSEFAFVFTATSCVSLPDR